MGALAIPGDETTNTATSVNSQRYFSTASHAEMASSLLIATGSSYGLLDSNPSFATTGLYHLYAPGDQQFEYDNFGPINYRPDAGEGQNTLAVDSGCHRRANLQVRVHRYSAGVEHHLQCHIRVDGDVHQGSHYKLWLNGIRFLAGQTRVLLQDDTTDASKQVQWHADQRDRCRRWHHVYTHPRGQDDVCSHLGCSVGRRLLETPAGSQSTNRSSQPLVRPQSLAPARKALGRHPQGGPDLSEGADENGQTNTSVNHGPNTRRRVDAEQQAEADDNVVDMDGGPANMGAEGATENASAALLSARPTASTRTSSHPYGRQRGGVPAQEHPSHPTHPGEQDFKYRQGVQPRAVWTTAKSHHVSLAPIDPLRLPRAQDASLPPFITCPLPGDPVKHLKPLTH
ncbi:hypothetical protein M407DRAFT_21191 [Tulasnella calospora MUT 4182]|uniref:Uncharacterized protein n=1 Tax=Tulasnella calospora MUT 4182 TaxID=1051891 RepID=A0A0C3QEU1_9AGAM|nr:hypothetical protein M407DRAFT_21191 [Tulasnella calospora MUT 4182]